MLSDFLTKNITSQAKYVTYGYGQVEPNHLSAQRTGQIYAQLPADANIDVLEQGQFVKYDYANGLVNFTGAGEWMLVFNEIKLYRDHQWDCEFAMIKDNYQARVYSPLSQDTAWISQSRYYNGVDAAGASSTTMTVPVYGKVDANGDGIVTISSEDYPVTANAFTYNGASYTLNSNKVAMVPVVYNFDDVTAAPDMYELHYNEDPFHIESNYHEKMMPAGTTMVPRVFKTNVGDIFTTNTIDEQTLAVGDVLAPRAADGILVKDNTQDMKWQVVKVYTLPDHQKAVKIMRIA